MPQIKRRHFLQFAGSTLAAMGLSQIDFFRQANQSAQVLAQSTSRKLALLIGIDTYPSPIPQLSGCNTDVDLQRELLIYRYGFNPLDIHEVRNEKATRQGILDAFEDLIKQTKAGDVVVIHYSGHGSTLLDSDPNPDQIDPVTKQGYDGALVPFDHEIPNSKQVRDITGHTLFLLTYALATENVTMVLDSCFSGGGLRGNTQIRSINSSRGDGFVLRPSEEELNYQQRWLHDPRVNLTPQAFQQKRKAGIAKGVAMGAAAATQEALEAPEQVFGGQIHAGSFTYLLTRYLWQLSTGNEPVSTAFNYLALSTEKLTGGQTPKFEAKPGSSNAQQPVYFLKPDQPAAEAVIDADPPNDRAIPFWLGGVSPQTLLTYETGAQFDLLDSQGKNVGVIELTGRDRLKATGKLLPGAKVHVKKGMLLREKVKGVPANLTLQVGLDASLGNGLPTIQKAIQSMNRVEVVAINPKQSLDCIFGRMTTTNLKQLSQRGARNLPPETSICLFNPDLTPIADSFGSVGESVNSALDRLRSHLQALLARKVLKTVLGDGENSSLPVSAEIVQLDQQGQVVTTLRSLSSRGNQAVKPSLQSASQVVKPLKPGTPVSVRVRNNSQETLYVAVLVISDSGSLNVLYPLGETTDNALLAKDKDLLLPYPLIAQGPAGYAEFMILASRDQLRDALKAVAEIVRGRGSLGRGEPLSLKEEEPLKVVDYLLGDISRANFSVGRGIDTGRVATFSTVIQVTD